jgi:hypothetical protein
MLRRAWRVHAAAALAACALLAPAPRAAQWAPRPLGGVEQLKSWFNANQSHARAIMLLSPT